jgi:transcriptional regulator with XRE-family HTH domain
MNRNVPQPQGTNPLGSYLKQLRQVQGHSLRQVEDATDVSNAYLSQLENDKIAKPSPHILYSLANFYRVSYDLLMEKAGYISKQGTNGNTLSRSATASVAALGEISNEEEEKLLEYLSFIRSRGPRKRGTL